MECKHEWYACNRFIAYDGEVVLECKLCGVTYYNAQDDFNEDVLDVMVKDENIPMDYAEQLVSEWKSDLYPNRRY